MSDDENNEDGGKLPGLDKYGYDPLDDIKPIETDIARRDDTYIDTATLLRDPAETARAVPERPRSALEARDDKAVRAPHVTQEVKDQVFKGDYFNLTQREPALRQIMVCTGWEQRFFDREHIDIDLSCFLLDKTDQTRMDEDFIFYNNPTGCNGAIKLLEDSRGGAGEGDDERIFFDLNGVPFDIIRIVFSLTIYDQEMKGHKFGDVRDLYLRVVNYENDEELARFIIPDDMLAECNGSIAAIMVREGPQWFFEPRGEVVQGGLSPIAQKYGLIIAEETG